MFFYTHVSSLEGRGLCTCLLTYIHTHTYAHIFQIKTAGIFYIPSEKSFILKFKLYFTILLQYHLAEDNIVLINCQNIMNYADIALYNQFGMLTWFKILVILLLYTYIVYIRI